MTHRTQQSDIGHVRGQGRKLHKGGGRSAANDIQFNITSAVAHHPHGIDQPSGVSCWQHRPDQIPSRSAVARRVAPASRSAGVGHGRQIGASWREPKIRDSRSAVHGAKGMTASAPCQIRRQRGQRSGRARTMRKSELPWQDTISGTPSMCAISSPTSASTESL